MPVPPAALCGPGRPAIPVNELTRLPEVKFSLLDLARAIPLPLRLSLNHPNRTIPNTVELLDYNQTIPGRCARHRVALFTGLANREHPIVSAAHYQYFGRKIKH